MTSSNNRGGRPRLAPERRRTEPATTRLRPDERRRLDVLLEQRGTSDADVIRGLLLAELDREGITDPGAGDGEAVELVA